MILIGLPISWLWMKSAEHGYQAFDQKLWPQRLIAFSIGIVIYTILTSWFFQEKPDLKTIVSISLAVAIVAIQVLWK
jgi:hypothetical protein